MRWVNATVFYLWTKTPSNTEQRREERSDRGKGRKRKKEGMKGKRKDKENILRQRMSDK